MKNTAINNLGYTGIVTISRYSGNKKIPLKQINNSGGNSLFNFLSNCLLGDWETAQFEIPSKIMLLYAEQDDDSSDFTVTPASGFIYFLTRPERIFTDSDMSSSTVCYSFIIPADIVKNAKFNCIGLYPEMATELEAENFAAICLIDDLAGMQSDSAVLVVDWKLTITNNG